MRQYLNATDKINSIRLELRHPSTKDTIWILVEGEDDIKLYGKFFDKNRVSVEQVHGGVENLRTAVSTLEQTTSQVIGIRDADFIHLNGTNEDISSLFVTDQHDTEMMMCCSDNVMDAIFNEYLNGQTNFTEIRTRILEEISFIGRIRWFNDTHNLQLNFKGISLSTIFCPEHIRCNVEIAVEEVNRRSPNKQRVITADEIEQGTSMGDLFNICNGHDFEKALAAYITSRVQSGVSPKEVGRSLRLSYTIEDFRRTILYEELMSWQESTSHIIF